MVNDNACKTSDTMMPKICYFFWGNETISFMRFMTIFSWIKVNPDFKTVVVLKRNPTKVSKENKVFHEEQDNSYYTGPDLTNSLMKLNVEFRYLEDDYPEIAKLNLPDAQTDDLLGWYVLSTTGGVKSDMDVLYFDPFPYEKYKDVDVSIFAYYNNCPIGLMFGTPNIVYKDLYNSALQISNTTNYQELGGYLVSRYFFQFGNRTNLNMQVIPNALVYPFVNRMEWKEQLAFPYNKEKCVILPPTIGIHWFGGFPKSKELNNVLTINNFDEHPCTLTHYIHEVFSMTPLGLVINNRTVDCKSFLDLCAGTGRWLKTVPGEKTAIELNTKYNDELKSIGYQDIRNNDVAELGKENLEPVDCVLWIDGIEHLTEEKALEALEVAESLYKKRIMVFTPTNFSDNKHNADKLDEPLQEHLSLFPKEFRLARGYTEIYKEYNPVEKVENVLYVKEK